MGQNVPKMPIFGQKWPQMHIFGPMLAVFGPKILIYHGSNQKFWYPYNGKITKAHCLHCFLVGHGTKWAKNANIWPNMPLLGKIWTFLGGWSKTLGTLLSGNQWDTHFMLKTLTDAAPIGCKRQLQFWPENLDTWGQKSIFLFLNRDIFQQGISPLHPGLQLSHSDHLEKISVSKLWTIFWGSPLFLAVSGHSHFRSISTLNFRPSSTS